MQNINPRIILQSLVALTFIALVTFLPSVQFMPKSIVWFNDRQRLLELLLLSLTLVHSIFTIRHSENEIRIHNKMRMALLSLLVLGCFSALLAMSPRHAAIEISVFAALCYFALFVSTMYLKDKALFVKWLTYAIWASILLYMVSFYVGYGTAAVFKTPVSWPQPFYGFTNVRSFNQYQLWTLGLIALPLLSVEIKQSRLRWLHVALAFWWVLLFYSASRGVLLAWLAGMLFTAIAYKKMATRFLRIQLIVALAGYCIYYVLFKFMPTFLQTSIVTGTVIRDTANDRIALWSQAITLIQNSPIFGVGPMHYAWHNASNGHPHNSILQLGAEWGLPATLIILAIAAYGIYSWFRIFGGESLQKQSNLDGKLAIALFFTIVSNAAYSLVDGVIVSPISQILMFTIIGLMIGQFASVSLTGSQHKPRLRPIIACITLLAMICSSLPEIENGLSGSEKGFSMGYTAAGPRFWRELK